MAGSLLFLKDMNKRLLGLSCSSAASASASVVTGRAIDRHSPHLRDPHRSMSKPPKAPKPTTGSRDDDDDSFSSSKQQLYGKKKKSSASTSTRSSSSSSEIKRLVSPASSSRFLLNSSRLQSEGVNVAELALPPPPPPPPPFIDIFPGDYAMPVPFPGEEAPAVQLAESSAGSSAASSSSEIAAGVGISSRDHDEKAVIMRSCSTRTRDQVVVLRVSLHCKGCAGKVKKHISKMEGVASFDIDIATKKVTVVGNVTPLAVLSSISKVKPAQFWPSPPRPPRASASF